MKVSVTLSVTTEIECRESVVTDSEFFRGYSFVRYLSKRHLLLETTYWDGGLVGEWPRDHSIKLIRLRICKRPRVLTFNICSNVVFPALSRPRNKSFACLLSRPRDERTSQTGWRAMSAYCFQDGMLKIKQTYTNLSSTSWIVSLEVWIADVEICDRLLRMMAIEDSALESCSIWICITRWQVESMWSFFGNQEILPPTSYLPRDSLLHTSAYVSRKTSYSSSIPIHNGPDLTGRYDRTLMTSISPHTARLSCILMSTYQRHLPLDQERAMVKERYSGADSFPDLSFGRSYPPEASSVDDFPCIIQSLVPP